MNAGYYAGDSENWSRPRPRWKDRVLLREPEVCRECGKTYLSLYPLRTCVDHDGLEGME